MRFSNLTKTKATLRKGWCAVLAAVILGITGCGQSYPLPYSEMQGNPAFSILPEDVTQVGTVESFAADLCIAAGDSGNSASIDMGEAGAAAIFDLNSRNTLYSRNAGLQLYPASMTKVMTALVALENSSTDRMLTATENTLVTEAGAQIADIKVGDVMTLDQALHLLLIYSANDAANLIAESIGGSIEGFAAMMNTEAHRLGATNTHFSNPSGLTAEDHYTTAYDMYLIFNEAMKYERFREIINMSSYSTMFRHADGSERQININSTNLYLNGGVQAPTGMTVIGGKTGTTMAAGHCLILLSRGSGGAPYISVVMRARDQDSLYRIMNGLLEEAAR